MIQEMEGVEERLVQEETRLLHVKVATTERETQTPRLQIRRMDLLDGDYLTQDAMADQRHQHRGVAQEVQPVENLDATRLRATMGLKDRQLSAAATMPRNRKQHPLLPLQDLKFLRASKSLV